MGIEAKQLYSKYGLLPEGSPSFEVRIDPWCVEVTGIYSEAYT